MKFQQLQTGKRLFQLFFRKEKVQLPGPSGRETVPLVLQLPFPESFKDQASAFPESAHVFLEIYLSLLRWEMSKDQSDGVKALLTGFVILKIGNSIIEFCPYLFHQQ